jgi:hypothetical protein
MSRYWLVLLIVFCHTSIAENSSLNLQIPNAQASYGSDKFKTRDLDCSNSIGGASNFEFGVTGIIDNATSPFSSSDPVNPTSKDIGMYARIIIPLDGPAERINCNTLYQLELRRVRLEILRLQEELEAMKSLNNPNQFE